MWCVYNGDESLILINPKTENSEDAVVDYIP
jgi:hypothetical protein